MAHAAVQPLPPGPVYWHLDTFDSLAAASRAAAGTSTSSIAVEAHGRAWLMTLESAPGSHHGGTHAARVGPIPVPSSPTLALQVMSATFMPGQVTEPHQHPGPEAIYVIEGEQCLELPGRIVRTKAGETAVVEGGLVMRMVGAGTGPRRALVLILHDASAPPTTLARGTPLASCR